jgi:hypothetical protein
MVFALNLHKKVQGIVEGSRAVFTYARSYTQKTCFGPPRGALVMSFSIQKPSQKYQNLTSIGQRFRSPFFLCLIQNLKAVKMGMVTAIAIFWSNKPNPAIAQELAQDENPVYGRVGPISPKARNRRSHVRPSQPTAFKSCIRRHRKTGS